MLVLVANSDNQERVAYMTALREAGYEAIGAGDTQAALAAAIQAVPAVVIIGLAEPISEAVELCRRLRTEAERPPMSVIVVMPSDDLGARDRLIGAGATLILTGPLKHSALVLRVHRLLTGHRMLRNLERRQDLHLCSGDKMWLSRAAS